MNTHIMLGAFRRSVALVAIVAMVATLLTASTARPASAADLSVTGSVDVAGVRYGLHDFEVAEPGLVSASLSWDDPAADLRLVLRDPSGVVIGTANSSKPELLSREVSEVGTYTLIVVADAGAADYQLDATLQAGTDRTFQGSVDVAGVRYGLHDFEVAEPGLVSASLSWDDPAADLRLVLRDPSGVVIGTANSSKPELLSREVSEVGTYTLIVVADAGAADYQLDATLQAGTDRTFQGSVDVAGVRYGLHDFEVAEPGLVSASLSWDDPAADLRLVLRDPSGVVIGTANSSKPELLSREVSEVGTYTLIVVADAGAADYQLDATLQAGTDRTFQGSVDVAGVRYGLHDFEVAEPGLVSASLSWDDPAADLRLVLRDPSGVVIGTANSSKPELLSREVSEVGTYTLIVVADAGAADYQLDATLQAGTDRTFQGSVDVAGVRYGLHDFEVAEPGLVSASLSWDDPAADLRLVLRDPSGVVIGTANSSKPELLSREVSEVGTYTLIVVADAGAADYQLDASFVPSPECEPVSELPCDELPVSTPFALTFDGTEGGLADTGFTLVDVPSLRESVDQSPAPTAPDEDPTFPLIPGYEPGLLTVDGGNLTIDATKGIQFAKPNGDGDGLQSSGTAGTNAQLNQLGVPVAGGAERYELTTTIVEPDLAISEGFSSQGGLVWFLDEDNYIKLVVARVDNTTNKVQLAVESFDAPTADAPTLGFAELNSPVFPAGQSVDLQLVVDATTGLATATYAVAGGAPVTLDEGGDTDLIVPQALLDGAALYGGGEPSIGAGLFATKRAGAPSDDVSLTFADFAVDATFPTPALVADPSSVELRAEIGATDSAAVDLTGTIGPVTGVDAVGSEAWLSASVDTTTTPAILTVEADATGLPGGITTGEVTVSGDGVDGLIIPVELLVEDPAADLAVDVSFGDEATAPPTGYLQDFGEAFGLRTGTDQGDGSLEYGWITVDDGTPVSLVGQGRNRTATGQDDLLIATTIHMEHPTTPPTGFWELAVPNGTYEVLVGVGDSAAGSDPEVHRVNAEGVNVVDNFEPTGAAGTDTRHTTGVEVVTVEDGLLTLDYLGGGVNTKLTHVEVDQLAVAPDTTAPTEVVLSATPGEEQVDLSWTGGEDDSQVIFDVFRSETSPVDTAGAPLASTSGSTYTDTSVVAGTEYFYVVVATDLADNATASNEASATPTAAPDVCSPISTLPCDEVEVALPFAPAFDGTDGGLVDGDGDPIGFTMVDPPSARLTADDPVSNPDVPGYEPSLLDLDPTAGTLTITATKGIAFEDPGDSTDTNSQINALGAGVDVSTGTHEITASLSNVTFPSTNTFEQAGLWFGLSEATFAKLVIINQSGGDAAVQLKREIDDVTTGDPADQLDSASFALGGGVDVDLTMALDAAAGTITGTYAIDGAAPVDIGPLDLPTQFFDGVAPDGDTLDPVSYAGVFASTRRGVAGQTFTFTDVAVTDTTDVTAPAVPTAFAAAAADGQVDLTWDANGETDLAGYNLYRSTDVGTDPVDGVLLNDTGLVTDVSFIDTDVVNGETYYYQLTAVDDVGNESDPTVAQSATPTAPACEPVSTLPCDDLTAVATPFSLTFDGTEGGLADTGFTVVDAPSSRADVDQSPAPATPSFPAIPGYEPGLLTVDGNLTIDATKGIQYATPDPVNGQQTSGTAGINAQLNGLGVPVSGGADSYELTTSLSAPAFDVSTGGSQQAGLWWFLDEDTYIKLVVLRVNNTTNRVQLAVESLNDPTADDPDGFFELNSSATFADGQDVDLRMVVDRATGLVQGFYTVDGGAEQQVGGDTALIVPPALLDGAPLADGLDPTVNAGVFATKRSAPATDSVTATFTDFAVDATFPTPALEVTPTTITETVEVDATTTIPVAVDVTTGDPVDATLAVTSLDDPWLSVAPSIATTTPATFDVTIDATGLTADTYTAVLTASADGLDDVILPVELTVTDTGIAFAADVNFNSATGEQPAGYELDFGEAYGDRGNGLTYGWIEAADGTTPLDLTGGTSGNGRDRGTSQPDQRLDSLVHMQGDDITSDGDSFSGVDVEGVWEIAVPDGSYEVTVAAGDPAVNNYTADPEEHALNVEGVQAVAPFVPVGTAGDDGQHGTGTVTVNVTDGRLTIDAFGGTNTKINYADITRVGDAGNTAPEVLLTGDRTLFVGQTTIIPVGTFDEDDDTVTVDVTGLPDGLTYDGTDITGTIAETALSGSPFTVEVTGDDGTDTDVETFNVDVVPAVELDVNFTTQTGANPAGWLRDYGQAFGARTDADQGSGLSYGWVAEGGTAPLDLTDNTRERGRAAIDDLLDTMIHMQYGDIGTYPGSTGTPNCTANECNPGMWELAVPDGLYEVTLSVGDQPGGGGDLYDSIHAINVEGGLAILEFQATSSEEYLTATVEAGVEDGRLTINAIGGNNTKLNWVQVRSLGSQPIVTQMIPPNRATDVAVDSAVSGSVSVPGTGVGVDPDRDTSLTDAAVKLFEVTDTGEVEVTGNRGSTGGNDTIAFSPATALKFETTYRYVIDGVLDEAGNTFGRFQSVFTTAADDGGGGGPTEFTPVEGVTFEKVLLPTASGNDNGKFIASMQVHQGYLWATTVGQGMYRYEILADGTLGPEEDLGVLVGRAAIGLVFDQDDPDLAWVTHATANLSNESATIGSKVSTVDFSDVQNPVVTDIFINLPRSEKDHLSNSMLYGPTGDGGSNWLYFLQGSNTAAGDTDGAWGNRGETQLTAALLRFDPQDALAEVAANGPINVATEEVGGTYDPFAANAPLEIYATGIRNAYDLVWHSNGHIYVPTNGTAAGGSSPGVTIDPGTGTAIMQSDDVRNAQTGYDQGTDVTDECATRRADGPYTGGDVPPVTGHPTQYDYLFDVVEGGYYGHPNPTRCEWVLNDGSDSPGNTGSDYPAGTDADPNYRGFAYNFDFNKSPNGVIEYQSETFGGQLDGRLMVVRFSNNDDVLTMQVGADGAILGAQPGSDINATGFVDPLEIIEDTATGNLYVNQYNRAGEPQELYLLRVPDGQQASGIDVASSQDAVTTDDLIMSATINTDQPTDSETLTITNTGVEDVTVTGDVTGTNAGDFTLAPVGTIPAGGSVDVALTFDPDGTAGVRTATLEFSTGAATETVAVQALAHDGRFGGLEPTLQQVMDTFQWGLDAGWTNLAGGTDPAPVGDEVAIDLFERAADGPVTMTPVAGFAPFEELPFGWYAETTDAATLNVLGSMDNGQQQTLIPTYTATSLEFDPGTDAFGVFYDSNTFNRVGYTEDARNTDGVSHRARIYPLAGDAFLVAFEDASNGDYQDYVFVLENVVAAGTDGGGGEPTGDAISVNFQSETAPVPTGYVRDFGQPYGARTDTDQGDGLTYGWVDDETFAPLDLVGNGRDRDLNDDQRLDTLMHMDLPPENDGGTLLDGSWEIALVDGQYRVTVSVGDPSLGGADENHVINVEGVSAIAGFAKSTAANGSDERHTQATVDVEVTDGDLTIDQIGGTNTKINYVDIEPLSGGGGTTVAQVNFQPSTSSTPTGWVADSGELFTTSRGYGWVNTEGGLAKTDDTRDRAADTDPLDGTLMIVDDAQVAAVNNGDWEYALANGTYDVTVSVGDPEFADSTHGVTAEGQTVLSGFSPAAAGDYQTGTATVEVTDGALTLASSGTNTKFQWVTITTDGDGGDVIPPQVAINLSGDGDGTSFVGDVEVSLDISDATLEFVDVVVDGTARTDIDITNYETPFTVSGAGPHTVEVTATDGAGNATTESVSFDIVELTAGDLTLTNPEAAPFDDRLVMSRIQNSNGTSNSSDTAQVVIGNAGSEPFDILGVEVVGDDFQILSGGTPTTLDVGQEATVEVQFVGVGSGDNQNFESELLISHDAANGPSTVVELAGSWQVQEEGGNEPTLSQISALFGLGTTVVGTGESINNEGRLEAIGDEVLSEYWERANKSQPIVARQLAAYHGAPGSNALRWHPEGNKGGGQTVLTHDGDWAQTLLPRINGSDTAPALASFTPSSEVFALAVSNESSAWTTNNSSPDDCNPAGGNQGETDCQLGHHFRLWQAEDRAGDPIPNTYLVSMDFSGINYDFQDNVYLVSNITPAGTADETPPAAPTGLTATGGDPDVSLDWDDNTETDLASYLVQRSSGGGFSTIATVTDSTYVDTSAPSGTALTYQVVAVDTSGNQSAASATASITTTGEPSTVVARINAGGPAITDLGVDWEADRDFVGGKSYINTSATVSELYQSERSATGDLVPFDYAIPVADGTYNVNLHLAEIYWGATGGGPGGTGGERVFSANIEGGTVELADYDINADVGPETPVVKSFTVDVADGVLDIAFTATVNQAKVSGIEILGSGSDTGNGDAIRINAGGTAVTTGGLDWGAQAFGTGGKTYENTTPDIAGTTDDVLFHTEYSTETGSQSFDIPVTNGQWEVVLHFAEIYFATPGGTTSGGVGSRVFDVEVEGVLELDDYDIIEDVGPATATSYSYIVDVADGNIDIDMTSVVNQAKVSAIEILPLA